MAMLSVPIHHSDKLTWSGKKGVAEHSDFGRIIRMDGRVYDDACDEGFDLLSMRTGQVLLMTLAGVDKDGEGDITGWRYHSVGWVRGEGRQRRVDYNGNPAVEVLIIND